MAGHSPILIDRLDGLLEVNSDLLSSLKELEKYMTDCGYFGGKNPQYVMAMKARAAIRKAEAMND